jgi:hypothetical protein
MKVKLFVQNLRVKAKDFLGSQVYALNQGDLEAEINLWLDQNPGITVVNIQQSMVPRFGFGSVGVVTSVWYEEGA